MKYIKTYEDIDNEPKVGDYVMCHELDDTSRISNINKDEINIFLDVNIGQIQEYDNRKWYEVEYENIPQELIGWFNASMLNCRSMKRSEILVHSKNKEDIEHLMSAKKYNL